MVKVIAVSVGNPEVEVNAIVVCESSIPPLRVVENVDFTLRSLSVLAAMVIHLQTKKAATVKL